MPARNDPIQSSPVMPINRFIAGAVFLSIAVVTTAMLTLESLIGLSLPGCGAGSACAKAAASFWGKIPGIGFPVSYLGLAYFASMLVGWLGSRDGISAAYKLITRIGVAVSALYLIILLVEKHLCWYCIITHIANILFWIIVERSHLPPISRSRLRRIVLVFILLNVTTNVMHRREKRRVDQAQETERQESTSQIIQATTQPSDQSNIRGQTIVAPPTSAPVLQRPWKGGFTGRYLRGSQNAPIRLVLFSDYQCVDCNRNEEQLRQILKKHGDIMSVSMKHFPMCTQCNPDAANLHANACWAARAAEAAGIIAGNDGFWKMNNWLFDHHGSFTDQELKDGVVALGFDHEKFVKIMSDDTQTLPPVKSDIAEALWLGIHYTPMVFINGVEFKGVFAPQALTRTIDQIAATNPPPGRADQDQPPPAKEKIVTDWREQIPRVIPPDPQGWPKGPADAKIRIVLWGDYQEPYTAQADGIVRGLMSRRGDIKYDFRHYPVNQACNPVGQMTKHPFACRAAAAAEAAGLLAGVDGYWKVHEWLMEHQQNFSDATVQDAARHSGLNPQQLLGMMDDPRINPAIGEDARMGRALLLSCGGQGIPFILVNDKFVPRWLLGTEPILETIINEAAKGQ